MTLEVIDPGPLTTVQDAGRPGLGHLGVPRSGACDPLGLAVANLLVGNQPTDAALEITAGGLSVVARRRLVVGLGGADLGASAGGRHLPPGGSYAIAADERLVFAGPPPGAAGFRAYLAVPGGIDVPVALGSRSTCLVAGFGGLDGRALRTGDLVRPLAPDLVPPEHRWPDPPPATPGDETVIGALPGPADPDGGLLDALTARTWVVDASSDRMGLRLDGPPVPSPSTGTLTHGVTWGAIQLPPDGRPIVLLADAQPTGGYPVIAVVTVADLSLLGQLRPGAALRVAHTTVDAARAALRRQRDHLDAVARVLAADSRWDELWRDAGAHPTHDPTRD